MKKLIATLTQGSAAPAARSNRHWLRRLLPPRLSVLLFVVAAMLAVSGNAHAQATGTVTYYLTDQQGTVLATADAAGNIISNADYRPYGTQALGTPEQGPGYTGHVNDVDSGLVYMQARYYDPLVGRFVSTDPVVPAVSDVYNFSRYAYADNNPVARMDPDGRDSVGEIIDQNARDSSSAGNHVATYAWAFAGVAWNFFGAESVSQVADKGTGASAGDMAMAAVSVATLGKGEEAGNIAKGTAEVVENVVKDSGTLFHYTDAAGANSIQASGMIKPDAAGRVFLTTDKIAAKDANNALFMNRGGSKGSHVVEVNMRVGAELKSGAQSNELIHQGTIRDGRQADLKVKLNDN